MSLMNSSHVKRKISGLDIRLSLDTCTYIEPKPLKSSEACWPSEAGSLYSFFNIDCIERPGLRAFNNKHAIRPVELKLDIHLTDPLFFLEEVHLSKGVRLKKKYQSTKPIFRFWLLSCDYVAINIEVLSPRISDSVHTLKYLAHSKLFMILRGLTINTG